MRELPPQREEIMRARVTKIFCDSGFRDQIQIPLPVANLDDLSNPCHFSGRFSRISERNVSFLRHARPARQLACETGSLRLSRMSPACLPGALRRAENPAHGRHRCAGEVTGSGSLRCISRKNPAFLTRRMYRMRPAILTCGTAANPSAAFALSVARISGTVCKSEIKPLAISREPESFNLRNAANAMPATNRLRGTKRFLLGK